MKSLKNFRKCRQKFHRIKFHSVMLLEVMIAFALVALCALPLIYPHVFILRSEKEFISTVELDHLVSLLYANRLQKLYMREISWSDIESHKEFPVDEALLDAVDHKKPLSYQGSYHFVEVKQKPSKPIDKTVHFLKLIFTFKPKEGSFFAEKRTKPLEYQYNVIIERKYHEN